MNAHLIECIYRGPTNFRGSRVQLISHRFPDDSISDGYDHDYSPGMQNQGRPILEKLGYSIICEGESKKGIIFAVREFKPLRGTKEAMINARKLAKKAEVAT
jgi:hypothetical protein